MQAELWRVIDWNETGLFGLFEGVEQWIFNVYIFWII